MAAPERCINANDDCRGPVEPRDPGYGRSFMRCEHHGEERANSYANSELERYANSAVAPRGFDPADAGEEW